MTSIPMYQPTKKAAKVNSKIFAMVLLTLMITILILGVVSMFWVSSLLERKNSLYEEEGFIGQKPTSNDQGGEEINSSVRTEVALNNVGSFMDTAGSSTTSGASTGFIQPLPSSGPKQLLSTLPDQNGQPVLNSVGPASDKPTTSSIHTMQDASDSGIVQSIIPDPSAGSATFTIGSSRSDDSSQSNDPNNSCGSPVGQENSDLFQKYIDHIHKNAQINQEFRNLEIVHISEAFALYISADRISDGQRVALRAYMSDHRGSSLFVVEGKMFEKFTHPNIIPYSHSLVTTTAVETDAIESRSSDPSTKEDVRLQGDYSLFLIFGAPYGVSISKFYRTSSPEQVKLWFRQLVSVLELLHSHSILHNGISDQTIQVVGGQAILVDLSQAKKHDPKDKSSESGDILVFHPPERARNQPLDFSSDIYSLGVLLYQFIGTEVAEFTYDHEDKSSTKKFKQFADHFSRRPISADADPNASDLFLSMCSRQQNNRITIKQIKAHPFLLS